MKKLFIALAIGCTAWIVYRIQHVPIVKNYLYKSNEKVVENVEGERALNFFYGDSVGKMLCNIFNATWVSKLYGFFMRSTWSKSKIARFIQKHAIDMSEYDVPPDGFSSFNDFFIRKLKPGARVIDYDQNVLVSPADSKLLVIPELTGEERFFVKSAPFTLKKFFGDESLAQQYEGGTLLLFRLAPSDYHRFHFPLDCTPSSPRDITGRLDSVNPIVYKTGHMPLTENERHVVFLRDTNFHDILFVAVGAMMVGKIVWTFPSMRRTKGDEAGYFEFGGSSIVLLLKKGEIQLDERFVKNSRDGIETVVKMGERIGVKL